MAAGKAKAGGNWSARLQMYVVILGAFYAYKAWKGKDPLSSEGGSSAGGNSAGRGSGLDCKGRPSHLQRHFTRVEGSWMSSLEAGDCSNMALLMVHQTSLSAETEFAAMIPHLLEAAPAGGLQVLSVDRPCHGYSPCPERGEPEDASSLLGRFLAGRPASQQIAYLASGRDAARHALATVQRRRAPARMLLVRPHLASRDSKGTMSVAAAIDSARWTVLTGEPLASKVRKLESLDVGKMPRGSTVTLMYLEGDEEDDALKAALEEEDVAVEVRYADTLEDDILPAVTDMLAGDGAATEDEV